MVSKSRARELARASAGRILPKVTLRQVAGDSLALTAARRFPNAAVMVGLPQYQSSLDLVIGGVLKSIFKQGGKSLSRAGIAQAGAITVENLVPLASRLLGGGVVSGNVGGAAISVRRVSN